MKKLFVLCLLLLLMTGCSSNKYYCKDGDKLSGNMCRHTETYDAELTCGNISDMVYGDKCVKRSNINLVTGDAHYSCSGSAELHGDQCVVDETYEAYTKDPNKKDTGNVENNKENDESYKHLYENYENIEFINNSFSDVKKDSSKVNIYMFYTPSCIYCYQALGFIKTIEKDYGKYFNLYTFDISEDDSMYKQLANKMGDGDAVGELPYFIVGKKNIFRLSK